MIRELEKMCSQKYFDKAKTKQIICQVDFKSSRFVFLDTTLLTRATEEANYEMVELLLESGANPNLVYGEKGHEENALWDLQYSSENAEKDTIRLNIVKLLLDYGASPHVKVEEEDLLQWAISNWGEDEGMQSDYRFEFIKLLEAYDA